MGTFLQDYNPLTFFNVLEGLGDDLIILGGMGKGLAGAFHRHDKEETKPKSEKKSCNCMNCTNRWDRPVHFSLNAHRSGPVQTGLRTNYVK